MPQPSVAREPITVLDLFAGCGGLTEGFHQFRPGGAEDRPVFRSVGAVEWEPSAAATYEMNFGARTSRTRHFEAPVIHCGDIVDWTPPWKPGDVDVVVGGPPCQGFSGLNRQRVRAERNRLWQEFIRVVEAVQPRVFVIENVDRFVRSPEFADLQARLGHGELENYVLVDAPGTMSSDSHQERARRYLLNSADFGASQARRRAIVIGVRTDAAAPETVFRYPQPTHSKVATAPQAALDGLGDAGLAPWQTVDSLFAATSARKPVGVDLDPHRGPVRGGIPGPYLTTELHITRRPEMVSRARYGAIPPGGNRKDLRGRYLSTFDDGRQALVEKVGDHRDSDGALLVDGDFLVLEGQGAGTTVTVTSNRHASLRTPSGRHLSESVDVLVTADGRSHAARLDYLSTPSWDAHDTGSGDVMGRLRLGAPSVTIRTEFFKPEKGRYLHPTEDRPITHYEAAKLQGFPDEFLWCGSKTDIARQIGNAVPVPLARSIAGAIYEYLRGAADGPDPESSAATPRTTRLAAHLDDAIASGR